MKICSEDEFTTLIASAIFGLLPLLFIGGIAFAMGASWSQLFGISVSAWTLGFFFGMGNSK